MANKLKNLRIDEGSFVDKGANKHAKVMFFKRDSHEDAIKLLKFLDSDEGQDFNEVLEDRNRLDDKWKLDSALQESINSIIKDDDIVDKRTQVSISLTQYLNELVSEGILKKEDLPDKGGDIEMEKRGKKISNATADAINAAMDKLKSLFVSLPEGDKENTKKGDDSMSISKEAREGLSEEDQKHLKGLEDKVAKVEELETKVEKVEELEAKVEELTKGDNKEDVKKKEEEEFNKLPKSIRKRIDDAEADAADAKVEAEKASEVAKAEKEKRVVKEYEDKAKELSNVGKAETVAKMLRSADEQGEDQGKEMRETLKSAHEKIEKGNLTTELGAGGSGETDAEAKFDAATQEIMKSDKISKGEATKALLKTNEGQELYNQTQTKKGSE